MKKIFIYLFGLLIAFASCAKVTDMSFEDLRNEAPQEIVFNMDAVKVTKSAVNTIKDLGNFGVYGYIKPATYINPGSGLNTGAYFMQNGQYYGYGTNGSNLGKSVGSKYYWPKSDENDIYANFVAYHPYTNDANIISLTDNKVKYSITANALTNENINDVLIAITKDYQPLNKKIQGQLDTIANRVPLHFKHALSLIQFSGKKGDNIEEVKVNSIKFLDNSNPTQNAPIYTTGDIVVDLTNLTDETFTITNQGTQVTTLNFAADSTYLKNSSDNSGTYDNKYHILSMATIIPQNVPYKVELSFNIKLKYDDNTVEYQQRTVTRIINTGHDDNNRAYPSAWVPGYRYTYRYYITVDEIKFDVDVRPWTEYWNQIWDYDVN